jgi:hypothetical protein
MRRNIIKENKKLIKTVLFISEYYLADRVILRATFGPRAVVCQPLVLSVQ